MTISAFLDAYLEQLSNKVLNNPANMEAALKELATVATARSASSGASTNGEIIGGTKTQIFKATDSNITIPNGCKLIYMYCQVGSCTITSQNVLGAGVGNTTYTLEAGESLNLEYPGVGGHGSLTLDVAGTTAISVTR